MANSSIDQISLDFNTLKGDFREWLRGNNIFKDYDFEGSDLNLLLDLMAYNTHKNAFYYNMAISEAFLDSAQTLASVVSHAKDLNYIPKSKSSAKATVRVTFEATGASAPYLIEKGAPFSTLVKNESFVFTIPENKFITSANNTYTFEADIYEGIFVRDTYTVNEDVEGIRYRLTNKNVDTASIAVSVFEDGSSISDTYKFTETLLGLDDKSKVFFLQAVGNGYYEILFGDNIFGRKPKLGATVVIEYRVTSGSEGNGAKIFSVDFDPTGSDELTNTPTIETVNIAADGSDAQEIESIRAYAPRYFATQQRAVASDDYASLLLAQFAGKIDDVTVYGGELTEPKMYGHVVIALKPVTGEIVPDFIKSDIDLFLQNRISVPTRTILVNPEYFHAEINTEVQYDPSVTIKSKNEIQGLVLNAISEYSATNLEKFDKDFRFSRFVKEIDDTDDSIVSNDTNVYIVKRHVPTERDYFTTTIYFNNAAHAGSGTLNTPVFYTSYFTWIDPSSVEYPVSYIQDNGLGTLVICRYEGETKIVLNQNIGSIDYETGIVKINKLLAQDYGNYLKCKMEPMHKDLIMNQDKILLIDSDDITVTVVGIIE